jgi:photosystem II stability/assembly factor-like uncharacterized protein
MTHSLRRRLLSSLLFLSVALLASASASAATADWIPVGPDGGDARSFAADPSNSKHLYLGSTNSWIYETRDGGATWQRLAKLSKDDDLIIDEIVADRADPKTVFVGAWVVDHPDGGLFVTHDSGKSWTSIAAMKGQSVRALVQAPSNSQILTAGTLRGVFRSEDGGVNWKQISPLGSMELHEVESVAVDPKEAGTIYAGTWHLPWKTTDGGVTWHSIKQGLIDDSDVFSIIIDPDHSNVVYTSACSGIYRSDNGGELYHKIQGIPSTARRTRVLMQDPVNHNIVYAGTTEGLYKTLDGGTTWQRMTSADVIVNDVYIDPQNAQRVLLATDRQGVLMSDDASVSFKEFNSGFSQRQVASLLVDVKDSHTLYAGVVNDKSYGGVFVSTDDGARWRQQSNGLAGRDVFSLAQAADGYLLAGTNEGILHWDGTSWQQGGSLVTTKQITSYAMVHGKRTKIEKAETVAAGQIEGRINAIDMSESGWFVAASTGIYSSTNHGLSWEGGPVLGNADFLTVTAQGATILAAQRKLMALSVNGGRDWQPLALPEKLSWLQSVAITPDGSFWVGGREGIFYSKDRGQSWQPMSTLPLREINEATYDPNLQRLLVTSWRSTWVLAVDPTNMSWKWWDTGWMMRKVHSSSGRLFAATLYNGVVAEPKDTTTSTTTTAAAGPGH